MLEKHNLAIIIPAYNEGMTIKKVIDSIPSDIEGINNIHIIAIDDGSIDNTYPELIASKATDIIKHDINRGLGVSFNDGVQKAIELDVDYVINLDGDGQHSPSYIPKFVSLLLHQNCDIIIGSRFINSSEAAMPKVKMIGNLFFSYVLSFLLKQKITDVTSGYRAYSKRILHSISVETSFSYTIESLINIFKNNKGVQYSEIPIKVNPRWKI